MPNSSRSPQLGASGSARVLTGRVDFRARQRDANLQDADQFWTHLPLPGRPRAAPRGPPTCCRQPSVLLYGAATSALEADNHTRYATRVEAMLDLSWIAVVSKQAASRPVTSNHRSASRSSSMLASDVSRPPSNAPTTERQPMPSSASCSVVHCMPTGMVLALYLFVAYTDNRGFHLRCISLVSNAG